MFSPCCLYMTKIMKLPVMALACVTLGGLSTAWAVDLARGGRAVASIVIPAAPLTVETYAARELQYHIEASTGARLSIVAEDQVIPAGAHVYLGNCKAAAGLSPSNLPGNGYVIKNSGGDLYIAGNDSRGDPLDLDTHEVTLFGVYAVLENELHVRWLWPGKLGEVIPRHAGLSL